MLTIVRSCVRCQTRLPAGSAPLSTREISLLSNRAQEVASNRPGDGFEQGDMQAPGWGRSRVDDDLHNARLGLRTRTQRPRRHSAGGCRGRGVEDDRALLADPVRRSATATATSPAAAAVVLGGAGDDLPWPHAEEDPHGRSPRSLAARPRPCLVRCAQQRTQRVPGCARPTGRAAHLPATAGEAGRGSELRR